MALGNRASRPLQSLFEQFATVLGGRVIGAGLQALSMLVLARALDPAPFGWIAATLGLVVILQTMGDLGATTFGTHEVAVKGLSKSLAAVQCLSAVGTTFAALLLAIALTAASLIIDAQLLLLLPLTIWLVLERSLELTAGIELGLGRAKAGSTSLVIRRALSLLMFVGLLGLGVDAMLSYGLGLLLGSGVVFAGMRKIRRAHRVEPVTWQDCRSVFPQCKPFWVHSLSLQIRNVDTLVVASLAGPVQAAFYGLASRLLTPLRMVPAAMASALLPYLSGKADRRNEWMLIASVAAALALVYGVMVVLAPPLVHILLGARYESAILPIQILLASLVFASCASTIGAALQARGAAVMVSRISTGSSAIFLMFVAAGAMSFGSFGAAIGASVGICAQMAVLLYVYVRSSLSVSAVVAPKA